VEAGLLVFESVAVPQGFEVTVYPSIPAGAQRSQISITSHDNQPLAPGGWGAGQPVSEIQIHLADDSGQTPASDALPSAAPDLSKYTEREVRVRGGFSGSFEFQAVIESAEIVAIEVLPAESRFLAQQHFDAALLLPVGSTIANAHASASGNALPLTYPGT